MILNYLNQQIELKIPKTTKRLKKEIREDLYNNYPIEKIPDESWKYKTPENMVDVKVNTIGIWMSGGADSSFLTYMLCKKIKKENLNIKLQPISSRRGRPWNPVYAGNVIDWIVNDLQIDFVLDHIVYYPDINDEYLREIKIFWDKDGENFRHDKFQILYSGITCNPPDEEGLEKNKERSRDVGVEKPIDVNDGMRHYMNPFFAINKKWLAEGYKKEGVLETLFPLTRSCEGSDYETGNYTFHCGKCWWCIERQWAFGRLV